MPATLFLPRDDTAIAYDRSGHGEALVLLHAGLGDRHMWDDQAEPFAADFDVIRIDARGFGQSRQTEAPYSSVDDVAAVLEALGVQRAHILGISMGSGTAIEFALAYPNRVLSLVVVASGIGVPPPAALLENWAEVDRLMEAGSIADANEYEMRMWFDGPQRTADQVNQAARQRLADLNRALLERDDTFDSHLPSDQPAEERLGEITAPTLILWGDSDIASVQEAGPLLTRGIANAQSVVMANTGHIPNMEHPEEFNRIVLGFLKGVPDVA